MFGGCRALYDWIIRKLCLTLRETTKSYNPKAVVNNFIPVTLLKSLMLTASKIDLQELLLLEITKKTFSSIYIDQILDLIKVIFCQLAACHHILQLDL